MKEEEIKTLATPRERTYYRKLNTFNLRSAKSKKEQYDIDVLLKKLQEKFPKEKFKKDVCSYRDNIPVIFLADDSSMLNSWHRVSNNYTDGLNHEFAKKVKSMGLTWSWHSPENATWWDGIEIYPEDFQGWHWYYGINDEPRKGKTVEISKAVQNIIKILKKRGFDATEPIGNSEINNGSRDRDEIEFVKDEIALENL